MHRSPAPSVSICIPAYNEESTIESAIIEIEAAVSHLGCEYEIIVCDDASRDGTADVLRRIQGKKPNLRAIFHQKNKGIRDTFEELYASATKEMVFLLPADLEWPPESLQALLLQAGEAGIVVASRVNKHYGNRRHFLSGIFNLIPRLFFGVKTEDAGAVKLVRTEIVRQIPILSRSPFSEAERIIRATRAGYRIAWVPTVTQGRRAGVSHGVNFRVLMLAINDVFRVWWDIRIRGR